MKNRKGIPLEVFSAYRGLGVPVDVALIDMGLINKTFAVTTDMGKYILQEISPIFDESVTHDADAVSRYLEERGMVAPIVYRADSGALSIRWQGKNFRALKLLKGISTHVIRSMEMARSAGALLGRFHRAVADLSYAYRSTRRHGGDYAFHRQMLREALIAHPAHDRIDVVRPLAVKMLGEMEDLTRGLLTTTRHAHGDPKISNFLFDEDRALSLVDFDTLGPTGWSLELADALRSWCNRSREDVLECRFDLDIAESAILGYASVMRGRFSELEVSEVMVHCPAIALCLGMRYLADVLNENYFDFDKIRFTRAADHNWLRAQAMYNLYRDIGDKRLSLNKLIRNIFNQVSRDGR